MNSFFPVGHTTTRSINQKSRNGKTKRQKKEKKNLLKQQQQQQKRKRQVVEEREREYVKRFPSLHPHQRAINHDQMRQNVRPTMGPIVIILYDPYRSIIN